MKARLLVLCLALGCSRSEPRAPEPATNAPPGPTETIDEGALDIFRRHAVEGAFVLFDARRALTTVVNPALASRGFVPASTFKIPNTLIGLETGVIPDEHFSLRWDGTRRDVPAWNRDHDLASAIKYSVVWFYQEVARRIGEPRMRKWVGAFDYGNRDVSGGIDRFWLDGGLRITAREQVDFLWRLHTGRLPVSREHIELIERLVVREAKDGVVFRGKTGLSSNEERTLGWLVGWVTRSGNEYAYATVMLAPPGDSDRVVPLREVVTRELLAREGALPADMAR